MGFQFSAVFDMMWKHPLVCGSILLLLTPSLFHILIYFSPLLISTALFFIALVSMKPRMEETNEERERWAKGEKSIPSVMDESWPYGDWSQSSNEAVTIKRKRSEMDGSGPTWMEVVEDWKSKFVSWVDEVLKAGEPKPLVGEAADPVPAEKKKKKEDGPLSQAVPQAPVGLKIEEPAPAKVPKPVSPRTPVEIVEEEPVIASREIQLPAAVAAPEPEVPKAGPIESREIDMPELETVEAPPLDHPVEVVATEKTPALASEEPIWDEAPLTPPPDSESSPVLISDDELMDVSLLDPVQETVHEILEGLPPAESPVLGGPPNRIDAKLSPPKEIDRPASTVFKSSPAKDSSTITAPAASARDVHRRILQDLHTQLDELQSKRRAK